MMHIIKAKSGKFFRLQAPSKRKAHAFFQKHERTRDETVETIISEGDGRVFALSARTHVDFLGSA